MQQHRLSAHTSIKPQSNLNIYFDRSPQPCYALLNTKRWANAHINLPPRARWIAKADVALYTEATNWVMRRPSSKTESFMYSESNIDHDTIQAYLQTHYRVFEPVAFTLCVEEPNLDLITAQHQRQVDCSAFVTACNPFSQLLDSATNLERQPSLARELNQRGLVYCDAVGQHPSNQWPAEASFLIYDLSLPEAKALGTQLEQNAITWSGAAGTSQLILLK
jgi:hypothetical protein